MSFKYKPWDFISKFSSLVESQDSGLYVVEVFDPFMERLLLKRLKKSFESELQFAHDISEQFIEMSLQGADLFASKLPIIISQAELLPAKLEKYFLDEISISKDRMIVLLFTKKCELAKQVGTLERSLSLKMEAPSSWDSMRYLNFLAEQMHLDLPQDVLSYLDQSLSLDSSSYVWALNLIKLNLMETKARCCVDSVKELISVQNIDQFKMVRLFTSRNFEAFYSKLITDQASFDDLRFLFSFLEGQLIKLRDLSYMDTKPRKTKWDQSLQSDRKLWNDTELRREIRKVGKLHVMSKQRSPFMETALKSHYYWSLL